jgi:hypothetical protein
MYHIYHRAVLLNFRIALSESYVLRKDLTLTIVAYFSCVVFQDIKIYGVRIASTTEVRASYMLLLRNVED